MLSGIFQEDILGSMGFYRLDTSEIAYVMGVSEAQVKKMIKKAEKEIYQYQPKR